jgi:hypothetical protein
VADILGPRASSQLLLAHVVAVAKLDLASADTKVLKRRSKKGANSLGGALSRNQVLLLICKDFAESRAQRTLAYAASLRDCALVLSVSRAQMTKASRITPTVASRLSGAKELFMAHWETLLEVRG